MSQSAPIPSPLLPPGYRIEASLAEGPGRLVARVQRSDSDAPLLLRAEGPGGREIGSELSVLASLDHPGIARLVDHGPLPSGGRFVVRTWIEGEDLATWAKHRTAEEVGRKVAETALALAHLHAEGFVHGDVKPENVLVTTEGRAVLCDFGLSRRTGITQRGPGASGTLFSIAPEQLQGLGATPSTDLFALGSMLHRLLSSPGISARDFYAAFPTTSFLDAVETDPEELPSWARDLVVALTARSPERRPASALEVARTLAGRLDLELPAAPPALPPRWSIGLGRDAWVASWLRTSRRHAFQWIRVPESEEPRPFFDHLRVQSALAGHPHHGIDLDAKLDTLRTSVELDQWAREASRGGHPLLVLVHRLGPREEQSLRVLAEAARLGGTYRSGENEHCTRLRVVSNLPTPEPRPELDWVEETVPGVDIVSASRLLDRFLPGEPRERREQFAEQLVTAAAGSATLADTILRRAVTDGLLQDTGRGYRLRPGDLGTLVRPRSDAESLGDLGPEARALFDCVRILGRGATVDRALRISETPAGTLLGVRRLGLIRSLHQPDGGSTLEVSPEVPFPAAGPDTLRDLHARQARDLGEDSALEPLRRVHAFCSMAKAQESRGAAEALRICLRSLRDDGRPEQVISLLERAASSIEALGGSLLERAPELCIERARALAALGRTDLARRELDAVEEHCDGSASLSASTELARGQIASLLHRSEEALERFERAAAGHPSVELEATLGRLRILHAEGRDRDVLGEMKALAPAELAHQGGLAPRLCAYMESICAMSAHRLGQTEEARTKTLDLVDDARARQDTGLEAALHINLSLMERAAGSLERAREELHLAMALYDRSGRITGLAQAQAMLGGLLRDLGELLEAEPLLVTAMETRTRVGDHAGATTARGILGLLLHERGHARTAIETLESSARAMEGAQRLRFAPLLFAVADEARARIGEEERGPQAGDAARDDEAADPRVFFSRAKAAWLRGDAARALELALRTRDFARSLKLDRLQLAASELTRRIDPAAVVSEEDGSQTATEPPTGGLTALDLALHRMLDPSEFEEERAARLAEELEQRGLDDRAARLFLALAARAGAPERAGSWLGQAEDALGRCCSGLSKRERTAFRQNILGEPDPYPADLSARPRATEEGALPKELLGLLEINKRLLEPRELGDLLGVIVEHACAVTGAERGFLALEEHGELRFDTALDSRRGGVAQPELEISASILREALEKGEAIRVSNAVDDPLLGHRTSVISLELRSILCVPFEVSEGLRGAIYLDHRLRKGAFGARAESLCQVLADQAALAVLQWKRLDEIRSLNRRLSRRVAQREADLEDARRALQRVHSTPEDATLVGSSRAMAAARARIRKAAPTPLPVLITGQSGTGKELAAAALHRQSQRAEGPFISESCAALPASLIESELFGFRRGAFTGADRDHIGIIEQANGGTLFLDEIGELPLELQAKLLRVLETHQLRRLGESETREVSFRLVSATNRDLEEEVREKRFRADLFYRLNGIGVSMPSLAERPEDIPELARHFLNLEAGDEPARPLSASVLTALARRPWPGNVRELRNEMARLAVLSEGEIDDPGLISRPAQTGSPGAATEVRTLAETEKRAIQRALDHVGGDRNRAAELLGISRAKIYQRLKAWRKESEKETPAP